LLRHLETEVQIDISRPRTPTQSATIEELGPAELPTVPLPKKEFFPSVRPKTVKPVEPPPKPKPKPQKVVKSTINSLF
jgi:hypothetical protein